MLELRPLNQLNVIFQALRLKGVWEAIPRYFFTSNLYAPARKPVDDLLRAIGGDALSTGAFGNLLSIGVKPLHAAGVMAVYALLFGALLYFVFLRRDID